MKSSVWIAALLFPALALADTTTEVQRLFDQKCAKCHFPTEPGKKGKNPTLTRDTTLRALIKDNYVDPGNPAKSDLYLMITKPDDDEDRMPKSTAKEPVPPLSSAEKDLIRRWIGENGAVATTAQPAHRAFVSSKELDEFVVADLARRTDAAQYRYLSFANLWNLGPASQPEAEFAVYRAAVAKLLNSLSWQNPGVAPQFVGPNQLLARVRLADYGWTPAMWDFIAARFPYRIERPELQAKLADLTRSAEAAVLRADWFVFVCSQSPLYEQLLFRSRMPQIRDAHMDADLEAALGIDVNQQLREQSGGVAQTGDLRAQLLGAKSSQGITIPPVVRAAFSHSGVSGANRLVDRHAFGPDSYYWKSYDFRVAKQQGGGLVGDLKLRPLGPVSARLTDNAEHVFEHDGGEVIFSLPNGLQGYLLVTAAGKFLSRAPSDVVQDGNRKDAAILNGISCMRCHEAGMQMPPGTKDVAKSDIRGTLEGNLARFAPREQQSIQSLYVSDPVLTQALRADSQKFQRALTRIGVARFDVEPVAYLYEFFRRDIRGHELLVELDIDPAAVDGDPERLDAKVADLLLKSRSDLVRSKAPLLNGHGVPRAEFIPIFGAVFAELAAPGTTLRPAVPMPVEEFNNVILPVTSGGEFANAKRAELLRQPVTAQFLGAWRGANGAAGAAGSEGRKGTAGSSGAGPLGGTDGRVGRPGTPGGVGGEGQAGGDGATAQVLVSEVTFQSEPRIARIEIKSATHGEALAYWDMRGPLVFDFRGGAGGEGGAGGNGGEGGRGGAGGNGDPTDPQFRRGSDGGDGGAGGNFGRGGKGGNGGNGGRVVFSIAGSADFTNVVRQLLRFDLSPGAPGLNGRNGAPGAGGAGGNGGRGSPAGHKGANGADGHGSSSERGSGYGNGAPGQPGTATIR